MIPTHRVNGVMWAFLRFTLVMLIVLPSSTFAEIHAEPTPSDYLSIHTPSNPPPIHGKPYTFQWTGDHPDFTLKLFDFTATLLRSFPNISNHSFTWNPVDILNGTEMYLVLTDALSNSTYSGKFTIQSGGTQEIQTLAHTRLTTSADEVSSTHTVRSEGLPTTVQTATTPAGLISSDASSPSTSEDTSSSSSSPRSALSTGAIVGISFGIFIVFAVALARLVVLYRRRHCQYLTRVHLRWTCGATAATKSTLSTRSRSESLPTLPFRRSGDSWSTQSSETRSDKPVAWNPGLFARDMSEEKGGSCSQPLTPVHQTPLRASSR